MNHSLLKLTFFVSVCLSIPILSLPAVAFEANQDVLVEKDGVLIRGWVVRSESDHSLVAYNWNAANMELLPNSRIKDNQRARMDPAKKQITGWTSGEIGLWHLAQAGNYLAAGSGGGQIQIFEANTLFPMPIKLPVLNQLTALAFSPDGETLATCQYSGTVKVFQSATGQELQSFKPLAHCQDLAFGTKQTLAIVGHSTQAPLLQAVWLYDLNRHTQSAAFSSRPPEMRNLSAVRFSPDGQYLAVGASNREKGLRIYEAQGLNLKLLKEIKTNGDVSALAFSPDGLYLAGGGSDQKVQLWKWQTGQRFWASPWHPGRDDFLTQLAFSPDGSTIAACGTGSGLPVTLYRMGNGKIERQLGEKSSMSFSGLEYSQDGTSLYTIRQQVSNFAELILRRYALN